MKKFYVFAFSILFAFSFLAASDLSARTNTTDKQKPGDESLRNAAIYELRQNTKSNFQFYMTNYGILGYNVSNQTGGGIWPRGSTNQYLFGSGVWVAAQKNPTGTAVNKYVVLTYNPNSGGSWFVPGSYDDGDKLVFTKKDKYRLYMSGDYDRSSGKSGATEGGPAWPVWKTTASDGLNGNIFINDTNSRTASNYPAGPAIYSDEDMVAVFKDGDLSRYDTTQKNYAGKGYPLRTDIQQTVFSWGTGDYKDMIIIMYKIVNRSTDTLYNCYIAPVYDFDLARTNNAQQGATNDRLRYYNEDDTLNLAVAWTNTDQGEKNNKFGYVGLSMLATPTVDDDNFIFRGEPVTDKSNQIGLVTFRNWVLADDKLIDDGRYDLIAAGVRDGDNGPGDKRMLMATGPFNMRPGDTAIVAALMAFALPSLGGEATGKADDLAGLVSLVKKGIDLFYNQNLTSVEDNPASLEGTGALVYEPWPNPANESACIFIKSPDFAKISATVYNLLGEKAIDLPETLYGAGMNRLDFNTSQLAAGSYIIKINYNGVSDVKMLNILK